MQELQLKMVELDETLVENQAAFQKAIKEFNEKHDLARWLIKDAASKNELTNGLIKLFISNLESETSKLIKAVGYESVLEAEKQERYKEIRFLNQQNRDLRAQLGKKASFEDIRESLKVINDEFRAWWNILGVGFMTNDLVFSNYDAKATLSGSVTGAYYKGADQSEKEKAEYLKWLGFDVCAIDVGRDSYYIAMTGENYTLLDKMLKSMFPSCVIESVTSHFSKRNNQQYILDIKICISSFDDFYSLTKP